jgi:hypothetical protein
MLKITGISIHTAEKGYMIMLFKQIMWLHVQKRQYFHFPASFDLFVLRDRTMPIFVTHGMFYEICLCVFITFLII